MKKWLYLLTFFGFSNGAFATIVLVANYSSNQITAYDDVTGEQIGTPFPITEDLTNPIGLATNPAKTLLYVANQNGGTINIYNLLTGQKVSTFLSGLTNPSGICLNADGSTLYVADFGAVANAYDTGTGAIVGTYSAGINGCSDVALSPDEGTLYVSNYNGHNVTVYNQATGSELSFSPITPGGGAVPALDLSLDGNLLYVCNLGASTVSIYNALTGATVSAAFLTAADGLNAPNAMRFNDDGTLLFVGNAGDNTVLGFDINGSPTLSVLTITDSINYPAGFAFMPSPILPPTQLIGSQKRDDFALEYELFNQLAWNTSLSEVSGYYVYRNNIKIATLNASTLRYTDHNRKKGVATIYSVTAFDATGVESPAATCLIK